MKSLHNVAVPLYSILHAEFQTRPFWRRHDRSQFYSSWKWRIRSEPRGDAISPSGQRSGPPQLLIDQQDERWRTLFRASMAVFWVVTPCSLVGSYCRFGGMHRSHIRRTRLYGVTAQKTTIDILNAVRTSNLGSACCCRRRLNRFKIYSY
jgi:hypothetical protein